MRKIFWKGNDFSDLMEFLNQLNSAQLKAVKATEGPVMIIAGPGSGKTRVLTYRIAYLLKQGVDAFRILALTFTNKASKEMRERIEGIAGQEAKNLWMGTFHSIFARVLRYEAHRIGYSSNFSIYDTQDSKSLIKKIVAEMGLNTKLYKENYVLNRISSAKNSLINAEAYAANFDLTSDDQSSGRGRLADVYREYARRCFNAGAMDFDDLLLKTYELLQQFKEVLHKYQNKFLYTLIDEFQDTNYAQYEIIKLLGAVHENVCVVGDDAQSIYGFRGATIQNILNLNNDYPDLQVYKLEQNYRSTKHIVHAANELIKNNRHQHAKSIWTANDAGDRIYLKKSISDNAEGNWVAETIFDQQMRNHFTFNDFAVLYRTNAQSRAFEEALRRRNIPYVIYGGLSFYQRKEVKDMLAYLRLTVNPSDEEALRRIINYPTRGIGKSTIERITVWAKENDCSLWNIVDNIQAFPLANRAKKAVGEFAIKIKSFQAMLSRNNAYDFAAHIGKSTGLQVTLFNDKSVEGLNRYQNYEELLNSIKEFAENDEVQTQTNENDRSLSAYLSSVALLTSVDNDKAITERVKLMTIHSAKGLEFDVVFVGGMEENLFPSNFSVFDREDLEEERRLFYVAVTRAKKYLYLTYASSRFKYGQLVYGEPSRFLDELPEENVNWLEKKQKEVQASPLVAEKPSKLATLQKNHPPKKMITNFNPSAVTDMQVGMRVIHQRFGNGKIVSMEGENAKKMATVFFNQYGNKKLLLKFAKLMIVD